MPFLSSKMITSSMRTCITPIICIQTNKSTPCPSSPTTADAAMASRAGSCYVMDFVVGSPPSSYPSLTADGRAPISVNGQALSNFLSHSPSSCNYQQLPRNNFEKSSECCSVHSTYGQTRIHWRGMGMRTRPPQRPQHQRHPLHSDRESNLWLHQPVEQVCRAMPPRL